ncbi:G patch domain-containing protein 11 [Madurella mycetomatis]|uniref:G patch domain-containing protein 11 n=1 Tax=Madurella mycetomatis TaxID=100816 RepID=A0A175WI38_9PEZI|nr:G patch domain-containing protein 11 [Madurella mycetomatis]
MASSEEEDYMTMTFSDDPTTTTIPGRGETSLQRRQRLRREAEARARPKSKAELAAEEEARREAALSQSLITSQPKSKGLAMMAKMGFSGGRWEEERRGAATTATTTAVGRGGRGGGEKAKRAKADEGEYRERLRREREEKRWEGQVIGAQKVAERMAAEAEEKVDGKEGDGRGEGAGRDLASRPLKSIPVVWRGLVRAREETERDRRMRYDLEQGLSRLPTYEDPEEDEDDKKALGKATARTTYAAAEDLDEEDAELDAFNALPADERLRRLVRHLREEHNYCFWCKFTYPDDTMEGCPGLTEEDHD